MVATSEAGDYSLLLIDERGCPVDVRVFPPFSKDPVDNRSIVAEFNAFKFPGSARVVFHVIVHYCTGTCEPVSTPSTDSGDPERWGQHFWATLSRT